MGPVVAPSPPRWPTSCPSEINPNDIPTLVVYHRAGGLTDEDLAAIDEQAHEIAQIDGVTATGC